MRAERHIRKTCKYCPQITGTIKQVLVRLGAVEDLDNG